MTIPIIPHPHTAYEPCPGGCKDLDLVNDTMSKTKAEVTKLELRLQESHDQLLRFETRLDEGSARMGRIEGMLSANTSEMTRNTSDTSEILQIMRESQAAFKLIERVGSVLKWTVGILAPVLGLWWVIREHIK